jgi:2,4-dienoyl-CoA reductase-like NADH-dependent reductase (Old Yellow Enzyme family)/thioredoxin reductase
MSKVLTPIEIGGVRIKNRVFLPGHTTNFGINNLPTDRNAAYLSARAAGGTGLIITEAIRVHPTSAGRSSTLGSSDDSCIPSFRKLTEAVHSNGAAIFAQIMHAGRQANGDATHTAAWSASAISWTKGGQTPHVMSQSDIATMVKAFGDSAVRMKSAGFDGLEVHLGHGHLIQQFLSPASNSRQDKYGGSLENRMRFSVEVLSEIFSRVPGMAVGVRFSADEFMPGGLDPQHMLEIIEKLSGLFDLNFIHVSHSAYHGSFTIATQIADMSFPHAPYRSHAKLFKDAFPKIPLLAVCRLDTVSQASELIDSGEADMVGLARPQIADPEIVNKFANDRNSEVRSCIACNQECIGRVEKNLPISCVVNPEVGAEKKWIEIRKAKQAKKSVLVVGGGPAGMSAAFSSHVAGHSVTLVEASAQLGGQALLASTLAKRDRFELLVSELSEKVSQSGITLKLNTKISDSSEILNDFDEIIVATGANFEARNFGSGVPVIAADVAIKELANKKSEIKEEIVIVDDQGTWIAASIAEQLASNGYRIHVVSPTASLFSQITTYSKLALIPRLKSLGVLMYLASEVTVEGKNCVITNTLNGEKTEVSQTSMVIDCGPRLANDVLYQQAPLAQSGRIHVIGDALSPRTVAEATFEGHAIGAFLDLDLAVSTLGGD